MGCTHSKRPKQSNGSLEPVAKSTKSVSSQKSQEKRAEDLKTGREPMKKTRKRKKTIFVYPESEVTPLPPEPPSFRRKERKKKKKSPRRVGTASALREFAREDKEAFLVDRCRVKEKKKLQLSDEDEDTVYELPTRMPTLDFSKEFEQASF